MGEINSSGGSDLADANALDHRPAAVSRAPIEDGSGDKPARLSENTSRPGSQNSLISFLRAFAKATSYSFYDSRPSYLPRARAEPSLPDDLRAPAEEAYLSLFLSRSALLPCSAKTRAGTVMASAEYSLWDLAKPARRADDGLVFYFLWSAHSIAFH